MHTAIYCICIYIYIYIYLFIYFQVFPRCIIRDSSGGEVAARGGQQRGHVGRRQPMTTRCLEYARVNVCADVSVFSPSRCTSRCRERGHDGVPEE